MTLVREYTVKILAKCMRIEIFLNKQHLQSVE